MANRFDWQCVAVRRKRPKLDAPKQKKGARLERLFRVCSALDESVSGFDRLRCLACAAGNLDAARLQGLGHFAHQVDMQHAVGMGGAADTDVIGEGSLHGELGSGLVESPTFGARECVRV